METERGTVRETLPLGKLPGFDENVPVSFPKSFTTKKEVLILETKESLTFRGKNKHQTFAPQKSRHSFGGCLFFRLHADQSVQTLLNQAKETTTELRQHHHYTAVISQFAKTPEECSINGTDIPAMQPVSVDQTRLDRVQRFSLKNKKGIVSVTFF